MTPGPYLSLLSDALVAVLLVATIVYAAILNRKLSDLRAMKSEMEVLIGRMVESTKSAQDGLSELRREAERSGETMQRGAERARGIADELSFLIERGDAVTRRLDAAPMTARGPASAQSPAEKPAPSVGIAAPPAAAPAPAPSPQEAALLKALQGLR